MSHYYQTQAITLKKQVVRENDCLYSFYTRDLGKVRAMATSAKKIKSRLSGHLEPLGIASVGFVQGYRRARLASAQGILRYEKIFQDIDKIFCAGYCLRLIEELVKEDLPDEKIYTLLSENLFALNDFPKTSALKIFNAVFTLKLLSPLGYAPELERCVICKSAPAPKNIFFSFEKGGLVCEKCAKENIGVKVYPNVIKLARLSLEIFPKDIFKIRAQKNELEQFNMLVSQFLVYHVK